MYKESKSVKLHFPLTIYGDFCVLVINMWRGSFRFSWISLPMVDQTRARFPSGAWDKICCSSSDMSMIQAQGFWAWAANLVSNSTWKPDPGLESEGGAERGWEGGGGERCERGGLRGEGWNGWEGRGERSGWEGRDEWGERGVRGGGEKWVRGAWEGVGGGRRGEGWKGG